MLDIIYLWEQNLVKQNVKNVKKDAIYVMLRKGKI